MPRKVYKSLCFLLCFFFIFEQSGFAQVAGQLNAPVYLLNLSSILVADKFRPLHLRYLSYDPADNSLDILLDKGDLQNPRPDQLQETTKGLLSYFLIGISLPNSAFWVNLRPDAEDNIIDSELEKTDVGRILLEADLELKKDAARLTSPETPEGKEYWDKLYKKAEELFGSQEITVPTFTRPWIVPGEIIIRETPTDAYVYKATLSVMLEQDYLGNGAADNFEDSRLKALNEYSSELLRQSMIPRLTKIVNVSKKYANLRQVYYSLILAQWFKKKFAEEKEGLYVDLIDSKNLSGLTSQAGWSKTDYFNQYRKSFKDGEYNVQAPAYTLYGQTIRNYFSGGIVLSASSAINAVGAEIVRIDARRGGLNVNPSRLLGGHVSGGSADNMVPELIDLSTEGKSSLSGVRDLFKNAMTSFRSRRASKNGAEQTVAAVGAAVGDNHQIRPPAIKTIQITDNEQHEVNGYLVQKQDQGDLSIALDEFDGIQTIAGNDRLQIERSKLPGYRPIRVWRVIAPGSSIVMRAWGRHWKVANTSSEPLDLWFEDLGYPERLPSGLRVTRERQQDEIELENDSEYTAARRQQFMQIKQRGGDIELLQQEIERTKSLLPVEAGLGALGVEQLVIQSGGLDNEGKLQGAGSLYRATQWIYASGNRDSLPIPLEEARQLFKIIDPRTGKNLVETLSDAQFDILMKVRYFGVEKYFEAGQGRDYAEQISPERVRKLGVEELAELMRTVLSGHFATHFSRLPALPFILQDGFFVSHAVANSLHGITELLGEERDPSITDTLHFGLDATDTDHVRTMGLDDQVAFFVPIELLLEQKAFSPPDLLTSATRGDWASRGMSEDLGNPHHRFYINEMGILFITKAVIEQSKIQDILSALKEKPRMVIVDGKSVSEGIRNFIQEQGIVPSGRPKLSGHLGQIHGIGNVNIAPWSPAVTRSYITSSPLESTDASRLLPQAIFFPAMGPEIDAAAQKYSIKLDNEERELIARAFDYIAHTRSVAVGYDMIVNNEQLLAKVIGYLRQLSSASKMDSYLLHTSLALSGLRDENLAEFIIDGLFHRQAYVIDEIFASGTGPSEGSAYLFFASLLGKLLPLLDAKHIAVTPDILQSVFRLSDSDAVIYAKALMNEHDPYSGEIDRIIRGIALVADVGTPEVRQAIADLLFVIDASFQAGPVHAEYDYQEDLRSLFKNRKLFENTFLDVLPLPVEIPEESRRPVGEMLSQPGFRALFAPESGYGPGFQVDGEDVVSLGSPDVRRFILDNRISLVPPGDVNLASRWTTDDLLQAAQNSYVGTKAILFSRSGKLYFSKELSDPSTAQKELEKHPFKEFKAFAIGKYYIEEFALDYREPGIRPGRMRLSVHGRIAGVAEKAVEAARSGRYGEAGFQVAGVFVPIYDLVDKRVSNIMLQYTWRGDILKVRTTDLRPEDDVLRRDALRARLPGQPSSSPLNESGIGADAQYSWILFSQQLSEEQIRLLKNGGEVRRTTDGALSIIQATPEEKNRPTYKPWPIWGTHFDDIDSVFKDLFQESLVQRIINLAESRSGNPVYILDWGAGNGQAAIELAEKLHNYNVQIIAFGNTYEPNFMPKTMPPNVSFLVGEAGDLVNDLKAMLPAGGRLGAVISYAGIHGLLKEEDKGQGFLAHITELSTLLSQDGFMALQVVSPDRIQMLKEITPAIEARTSLQMKLREDATDAHQARNFALLEGRNKDTTTSTPPISSPVDITQTAREVGGIDFRSLPISAQSPTGLLTTQQPIQLIPAAKLGAYWQDIQKTLQENTVPSSDRILSYIQSCCDKEDAAQEIEKVVICITEILRLEEDQVIYTDPALKQILAILESRVSPVEIRAALSQVNAASFIPAK